MQPDSSKLWYHDEIFWQWRFDDIDRCICHNARGLIRLSGKWCWCKVLHLNMLSLSIFMWRSRLLDLETAWERHWSFIKKWRSNKDYWRWEGCKQRMNHTGIINYEIAIMQNYSYYVFGFSNFNSSEIWLIDNFGVLWTLLHIKCHSHLTFNKTIVCSWKIFPFTRLYVIVPLLLKWANILQIYLDRMTSNVR